MLKRERFENKLFERKKMAEIFLLTGSYVGDIIAYCGYCGKRIRYLDYHYDSCKLQYLINEYVFISCFLFVNFINNSRRVIKN